MGEATTITLQKNIHVFLAINTTVTFVSVKIMPVEITYGKGWYHGRLPVPTLIISRACAIPTYAVYRTPYARNIYPPPPMSIWRDICGKVV